MGSVDFVWLILFVRVFLNSLAREILRLEFGGDHIEVCAVEHSGCS